MPVAIGFPGSVLKMPVLPALQAEPGGEHAVGRAQADEGEMDDDQQDNTFPTQRFADIRDFLTGRLTHETNPGTAAA